jgi:hypothetical protein
MRAHKKRRAGLTIALAAKPLATHTPQNALQTVVAFLYTELMAFFGNPPANYTFRRTVGYVLNASPAGAWWETIQTSLSILGASALRRRQRSGRGGVCVSVPVPGRIPCARRTHASCGPATCECVAAHVTPAGAQRAPAQLPHDMCVATVR